MLKLIRNMIDSLETLIIPNNGTAKWEYFVKLDEIQRNEGLRLGNKVTIRHINYHNQKMKVNLAAQLLSSSFCGIIFTILRISGYVNFQGLECTESFVKTIDRVFDMLNSHSIAAKEFKKALCR